MNNSSRRKQLTTYTEEWARIEKAARSDPRFRFTYAYIKEWAHVERAAIELEKSES
jgi:hypothetical protein